MEDKMYWVAFAQAGADSKDLFKLAKFFGRLEEGWRHNASAFRAAGLETGRADYIQQKKKSIDPEKEWQKLEKNQIKVIIWPEKNFPELLKQIADPAAILFIKGNTDLIHRASIGVVGTRKSTFYGEKATRLIVSDLAQSGLTVVSGLARGIDTAAHLAALAAGGATIGVAPYGFYQIPYFQERLINKILRTGAIVTEYSPYFPAHTYSFVQRNRLISGLAQGVLVTEAPAKSGALITAEFALEQNRDIWAVPGPIDQENFAGTNRLIKEGAMLTAHANDILQSLNWPTIPQTRIPLLKLSINEQKVFDQIRNQPITFDQLTSKTGLTSEQILTSLTLLEIKELIRKDDQQKYRAA